MIPGILNKTIDGIDIIKNKLKWDFDFVLRTTVATCIKIPELLKLLDELDSSKSYYIGNLQKLEWIDIGCGIVDKTYWGTWYTGGGFTIFSADIANKMIINRDKFVYNIVDDLSIGYFISGLKNIHYENWSGLVEYYGRWNSDKIVFCNNTNKSKRETDVINHAIITNNL
jgi:hypothetical protein